MPIVEPNSGPLKPQDPADPPPAEPTVPEGPAPEPEGPGGGGGDEPSEPSPTQPDNPDGGGSGPTPAVPDSVVPPAMPMPGQPGQMPQGIYGQHPPPWYGQYGAYGPMYGVHNPHQYPGLAGSSSYHHPMVMGMPGPQLTGGQYGGGYGPQIGSDGPRLLGPATPEVNPVDLGALGASLAQYGTMLSTPGAGNNQNMTDILNDVMNKVNTAMKGMQMGHSGGVASMPHVWQASANHNAPGVGVAPRGQPTHLYSVNNIHMPAGVVPGPDIGYGGNQHPYGRSAPRNPYAPGSMQHKLRAMGVTAKTIDSALEGECIDLAEFMAPIGASSSITNPELEPILDNNTHTVTYRPKKYTR